MEAGKIIATIKSQGIHDEPCDPWPELVFEINQFLLTDLLLILFKDPVKVHF
jgi:hypothetical protein